MPRVWGRFGLYQRRSDMGDSLAAGLAGVALAAGAGTRLRPLTLLRPKPLCPVGDRSLLDWALEALEPATGALAVNVHHGREQIEEHLHLLTGERGIRVHVSVEAPRALGTAGALGALRPWLDGRDALVVNADTFHRSDLQAFVRSWDRERVSVLTPTPGPFGPRSAVVASLLPWWAVARLAAEPAGLWETLWRGELAAGRLTWHHEPTVVVDCGTPAAYLRANLIWSSGASVIGAGAQVSGRVERCVVWPGARVAAGEELVDAVRAGRRTLLVR